MSNHNNVSLDEKSAIKKKQFLLTNLIVIILVIICLILLILAYPIFMKPTSTGIPEDNNGLKTDTIISEIHSEMQNPTITSTRRPTFTPSITPTSTWTQVVGPTSPPIGPSTITPALPSKDLSVYSMRDWSAADANYMIKMMQGYPATLLPKGVSGTDPAFYQAFEYAVVAEKEAILRFPESEYRQEWDFSLAFDLAQTGSSDTGEQYANILSRNLNNGSVQFKELKNWFESIEPRMTLSIIPTETNGKYINSYLIEIKGNGAAYIWIVQTSTGYKADALVSHFDFVNRIDAHWILSDLVGDFLGEELVVYYTNPSDNYELDAPYIFGFYEGIPVELGFQPEQQLFEIGVEYSNYWRILVNEQGENELIFETHVFPSCRVRIRQAFEWNGTHFVEKWTHFDVEPDTDNLNYCEFNVEHAINYWGPDAAIQIMEPILPYWPPEKDLEGNAYPLDAKDEWVYRLGIYYALIGNYDKSIGYLSEVVQNPNDSLSRWIEPAEDFLLKYKKPEDVYTACIDAQLCDPDYALETLIRSLSVQEFNDVMQVLWDNQVNILSSGYFDFDKDGTKERWIVVRHRPLEAMRFWILAADKKGGKGLNVGEVMNIPPAIDYLDRAFIEESDVSSEPIIFIDSKIAFQMKRIDIGLEAYIIYIPLRKEYPDKFALGLAVAENTLFDGEIEEANKQLLGLQEFPGLLCENTWSCDRYYYLLGLSEELLEDENQALSTYVELWRNYSKSQFTMMGRLKIEGGILPTATLTNTPTLNTTATSGITLTPIPSTTISSTPTSATPSFTTTPGTAYPPQLHIPRTINCYKKNGSEYLAINSNERCKRGMEYGSG